MTKSSHIPIYNSIQTKNVKYELSRWIASFKPSHFLSVQFPINLRSDDFDASLKILWQIMREFERILLKRHWANKHLPFIAMAEHNATEGWHYHILFYDCKYPIRKLRSILKSIIIKMYLTDETFELLSIKKSPYRVYDYCLKDTKVNMKREFDPICIIPSHVLFNIKVKTSSRAP